METRTITTTTTQSTPGYRVLYRDSHSKESGIGYGKSLQDMQKILMSWITDHMDSALWVIQYGVDGGWKTIENSGYFRGLK